jgi:alpha-amylase
MSKLRFALTLHNHQPIGNFDHVIEQAYEESYAPFLDVAERFPEIRFSLHVSGCLMDWLVRRRPEYVDRLRRSAASGQVEILGGGCYEPILPMIPQRDRVGQIRGYTERLRETLDCDVRGMWLAERVWEPSLATDVVDAGMEFTILDDYHFLRAGVPSEALFGSYTTEDQGRVLRVFPGSERARYMIPFHEVSEVLEYFRAIHQRASDALIVFADDGEKFGTWPNTKAHVYERGWLQRFFEALCDNREWIDVCTLSEALEALPPVGHVYLPECSYREMTEWSLEPGDQIERAQCLAAIEGQPWGAAAKKFIGGGSWRNFKVRYPETREMYARMMEVSRRLEDLVARRAEAFGDARVHQAREAMYRGQCNCAYWHGAFGGLYLPHLRTAVYHNLIHADNQLLAVEAESGDGVATAAAADWNLDGREEVKLSDDALAAYAAPHKGGQIYELDVRGVAVNLGATVARRREAYHDKIFGAADGTEAGEARSIHNGVRVKPSALGATIGVDVFPRKLLVDRFLPEEATAEEYREDRCCDLGDFHWRPYDVQLVERRPWPRVMMARDGSIDGRPARVQKEIALSERKGRVRVRYHLSGPPRRRPIRFVVEWNVGALASGVDDRYVLAADGRRIGRIGDVLELAAGPQVALVDEWIGIKVSIGASQPFEAWLSPIETASQSEDGVELVFQGCRVATVWMLPVGGAEWEGVVELDCDCTGGAPASSFKAEAVAAKQ